MLGLGFSEIAVILIVVLLVFGPERLPDVARGVGRTLGEFRRTLDEMKREFSLSALTTLPDEEPLRRQILPEKQDSMSITTGSNFDATGRDFDAAGRDLESTAASTANQETPEIVTTAATPGHCASENADLPQSSVSPDHKA